MKQNKSIYTDNINDKLYYYKIFKWSVVVITIILLKMISLNYRVTLLWL